MLLLFLSALVPSNAVDCPVERARYELRGESEISARFHPVRRTENWRSGVALEIRDRRNSRVSWWLPTDGGTADNYRVRWTARRGLPESAAGYGYNLGDLQFFGFDRDYNLIAGQVTRQQPAPGHILLDNLSHTLWIRDDHDSRLNVPRQLFDLVGCEWRVPADADVLFPPVP